MEDVGFMQNDDIISTLSENVLATIPETSIVPSRDTSIYARGRSYPTSSDSFETEYRRDQRRRFTEVGRMPVTNSQDTLAIYNQAPPQRYVVTPAKKRQAVEVLLDDRGDIDLSRQHSRESHAVAGGYYIPGMPNPNDLD